MKKRILLILLLILLGGIGYATTYELKNIRVTGCFASDPVEIENAVKEYAPLDNILLLYIRNRFKGIDDITFVSKLDFEFVDRNTIEVIVYEKSMAGCIRSMDSYVYFDKDGVVLDSSKNLIPNVPMVKGLEISEWELGKKLLVEDKGRFQTTLTITQLVAKYELVIDSIEFTTSNEIVLTHDDITIELGEGEYLAVQLMNLGNILEKLDGMKGILYMKDFNTENQTASFRAK